MFLAPVDISRRLSVLDREKGTEEDASALRRTLRENGNLPDTPNGKIYGERMKELKKIISQRVRNKKRVFGSPSEAKKTPDKR